MTDNATLTNVIELLGTAINGMPTVGNHDPLQDNLVMTTVGDTGLEAFKNGWLSRNGLIFDKVKSFTYFYKTINTLNGNGGGFEVDAG